MDNNVNNFIGDINHKFSSVIDKILHHQYLSCLENQKLSREDLKVFVCEQYHIISNDKRDFALAASRTSNTLSANLFQDCLSFESSALENLFILAKELNLETTQLKSYEPLAGCQTYTNYLTRLSLYGSEAEIMVAMLTDLPIWGENCKRISTALKKYYGFTEDSCIFLDRFAAPLPEEFLKKSMYVIESDLYNHRTEMITAARLILDYELIFWDTIYQYLIKT